MTPITGGCDGALEETLGVCCVVPLIRVGDHHRSASEGELDAALIASRLHPPILVRETPASPFRDAVGAGGVDTGYLGAVHRPTRGRCARPHVRSRERFLLIGTEGQPLEVLDEYLLRVQRAHRRHAGERDREPRPGPRTYESVLICVLHY